MFRENKYAHCEKTLTAIDKKRTGASCQEVLPRARAIVDGKQIPPFRAPNKTLIRTFLIFSPNFRVLKLRFLFFPGGSGGFRKLRGPGRNHFHLSWYLQVHGVTSHGQKPWGRTFPSAHGMTQIRDYISTHMNT